MEDIKISELPNEERGSFLQKLHLFTFVHLLSVLGLEYLFSKFAEIDRLIDQVTGNFYSFQIYLPAVLVMIFSGRMLASKKKMVQIIGFIMNVLVYAILLRILTVANVEEGSNFSRIHYLYLVVTLMLPPLLIAIFYKKVMGIVKYVRIVIGILVIAAMVFVVMTFQFYKVPTTLIVVIVCGILFASWMLQDLFSTSRGYRSTSIGKMAISEIYTAGSIRSMLLLVFIFIFVMFGSFF